MSETLTAIGIGGNLGNREDTLNRAIKALAKTPGINIVRQSPWYETAPVGFDDQPFFLNGALAAISSLTPRNLLLVLHRIEHRFGRIRNTPDSPRRLDLDLLLFDDLIIDEADLVVPHPRMTKRAFVLVPLADILPEAIHPVTRSTIADMLFKLGDLDQLVTPYSRENT